MEQVIRNKLSDDEINFLLIKNFDSILINSKILSKEQILEKLRNIRDELNRFC